MWLSKNMTTENMTHRQQIDANHYASYTYATWLVVGVGVNPCFIMWRWSYKYLEPRDINAAILLFWRKMYLLRTQSFSRIAFNSFISTVPRKDCQFMRQFNKNWSCIGWFLLILSYLSARKCQGPRRGVPGVSKSLQTGLFLAYSRGLSFMHCRSCSYVRS